MLNVNYTTKEQSNSNCFRMRNSLKFYFGSNSAYSLNDLFESDFNMVNGSSYEEESCSCSLDTVDTTSFESSESTAEELISKGGVITFTNSCILEKENFQRHDTIDLNYVSVVEEDWYEVEKPEGDAKKNEFENVSNWIDEDADADAIIKHLQVDNLLETTLDLNKGTVCDDQTECGTVRIELPTNEFPVISGSVNGSGGQVVEYTPSLASTSTPCDQKSFTATKSPYPQCEECGNESEVSWVSSSVSPPECSESSTSLPQVSCENFSAAADAGFVIWQTTDICQAVNTKSALVAASDDCLGDNCGHHPSRSPSQLKNEKGHNVRRKNHSEKANLAIRKIPSRPHSGHSLIRKKLKAKKLCRRCCPPDCFEAFVDAYKRIRRM